MKGTLSGGKDKKDHERARHCSSHRCPASPAGKEPRRGGNVIIWVVEHDSGFNVVRKQEVVAHVDLTPRDKTPELSDTWDQGCNWRFFCDFIFVQFC